MLFCVITINDFRGDLADVLAKTKTLLENSESPLSPCNKLLEKVSCYKQWFCFQNWGNHSWDTLMLWILIFIIRTIIFKGDLSDVSTTTKALTVRFWSPCCESTGDRVFILADTSGKSPWKLLFLITYNSIYRIEASKTFNMISRTRSLTGRGDSPDKLLPVTGPMPGTRLFSRCLWSDPTSSCERTLEIQPPPPGPRAAAMACNLTLRFQCFRFHFFVFLILWSYIYDSK